MSWIGCSNHAVNFIDWVWKVKKKYFAFPPSKHIIFIQAYISPPILESNRLPYRSLQEPIDFANEIYSSKVK